MKMMDEDVTALPVTDWLKLPEEILEEIFKYLPVRDRKAAKLVCKKFWETFDHVSLADSEKLSCTRPYSPKEILQTLTTFKQKIRNVVFSDLNFECDSTFWIKRGPEVRYLKFIDCFMSPKCVRELIIHCENLSSLHWKHPKGNQILFNDEFFTFMEEGKIVRKNLKHLKIIDHCQTTWISTQFLCSLFKLFPAIKKLTIAQIRSQQFEVFEKLELNISEHLQIEDTNTSPEILKTILNSIRIKKRLYFSCKFYNFSEWIIPRSLEHCGLFLTYFQDEFDNRHPHHDSDPDSGSVIVSKFLENCPDLRHLQLDICYVTKRLFTILLQSSLETLELKFDNCDSNLDLLRTLRPNYTVHNLKIEHTNPLSEFLRQDINQLLELFRNLEHLMMKQVHLETMQIIFQHQVNLKSLEISLLHGTNDNETFTYNISRLRKLECLSINMMRLPSLLVPNFDRFILSLPDCMTFPNLRHLEIDESRCLHPFPKESIRFSPIESLFIILQDARNSFKDWISLCRNLTRLRVLRIYTRSRKETKYLFTVEECTKFFEGCPSLRIFYVDEGIKLWYNILKKEVQSKSFLDPFTHEKFSPFRKTCTNENYL